LWDSRYRSSLIQAETYRLTCQRYLELNPVRAARVEDPAHYRWTSYRSNARGQASVVGSRCGVKSCINRFVIELCWKNLTVWVFPVQLAMREYKT
jgi:hypothetical protein